MHDVRKLRRRRVLAVLAVLLVAAVATPATAVESTDVTGDITEPTVVSFTVSPAGADVTTSDAIFSVELHVTDDLSGVEHLELSWHSLGGTTAHGVNLQRWSGDANDGRWSGTFSIPRYSPPGRYRFFLGVSDRVRNARSYDAEALASRGLASGVDITDADPDGTAPSVRHVRVTPSTVDVRTGAATADVEVAASDAQSGVSWVVVFLTTPVYSGGGAQPPIMRLATGTTNDGVWRGTVTFPRHTREGHWTLKVSVRDELRNWVDLTAAELDAAGLQSGIDVLSHEDADPPRLPEVTIHPAEINVHDQDQTVRVRVRATDDLTGVAALYGDNRWHEVHVNAFDPVTRQNGGLGAMARVSGDAMDGVYEGSFVVPKSSATGLRALRVSASDAIANTRWLQAADLVAAGGPAALLVYNVPLPPAIVGAEAGDRLATLRWDPPADDRGAAVTRYVITESPGGAVVEAPADARSAVVANLTNGATHSFTVAAVNKAGASDASEAVSATPQAEAPTPSSPATSPSPATPASPGRSRSGYWMVASTGSVHAFGDAPWLGHAPVGGTPAVDVEATPSRDGYWVVDAAGRVFAFGDAPYLGGAETLPARETVTSLSATPSGGGYWLFTTGGRVLAFGDARLFGDMSAARLNGRVLDSVPTPSGQGYYMVAADGGVFCFGDARFAGSMSGARLNAPVESLVPTPDGAGYWLVASDGGVFAFGAPFHGSMGSAPLNKPVTGMVGSQTGRGYLMVGEDGGIFAFGDVAFRGSLGNRPSVAPITAVASV